VPVCMGQRRSVVAESEESCAYGPAHKAPRLGCSQSGSRADGPRGHMRSDSYGEEGPNGLRDRVAENEMRWNHGPVFETLNIGDSETKTKDKDILSRRETIDILCTICTTRARIRSPPDARLILKHDDLARRTSPHTKSLPLILLTLERNG
jgi:hypothetical protein